MQVIQGRYNPPRWHFQLISEPTNKRTDKINKSTGGVAHWLVHPNSLRTCTSLRGGFLNARYKFFIHCSFKSNPKTLHWIPWRGRVKVSFSVPPSQLLCRPVCAWSPFVCTVRTQICAHVKDPISVCRKRVGIAAGGMHGHAQNTARTRKKKFENRDDC